MSSHAKGKHNVPEKPAQSSRGEAGVGNPSILREVRLLLLLGVCILLFLGSFGWAGIGDTGINWICSRLRGVFGLIQYGLPVLLAVVAVFLYLKPDDVRIRVKLSLVGLLFLLFMVFVQFCHGPESMGMKWKDYYAAAVDGVFTAGGLGGKLASLLFSVVGFVGGIVILILLAIVVCVLLTERSFLRQVRKVGERGGRALHSESRGRRNGKSERRGEHYDRPYQNGRGNGERRDSSRRERPERPSRPARTGVPAQASRENREPVPQREPRKSANGMSLITLEKKEKKVPRRNPSSGEDMQELFSEPMSEEEISRWNQEFDGEDQAGREALFTIQKEGGLSRELSSEDVSEFRTGSRNDSEQEEINVPTRKTRKKGKAPDPAEASASVANEIQQIPDKDYVRPPLSLLKSSGKKAVESDSYLRSMGMTLQKTLQSFGVNVTVTNVSCGPSVTRYELQPEQGVKVSKITNLADDIKLNLAVSEIRIEAPIPGKAAVGIEVPNRNSSPVFLRELLESQTFEESKSPLTFAVGKDISGNIITSDIAKMPHLLVAGATGSGKSVCINTIIMSLLYKADPRDLKLILIDPKVVELSIYNGIPHMFIPVVTDPKKAAGALNWAVVEMDDRYNKMSEMGVRDLEGYNRKVAALPEDAEDRPEPFSRLVIIVDELADLMMVCGNEVEAAICRLAQKARAAGIHLILATQRPSVDVITGLIKANMPSRIAFAVSSGVDSRTIIDINGAEKLLGKGDMLFYPASYPKPVRVQGAFVSDKEVSDVVEFLSEQNREMVTAAEIQERMSVLESAQGSGTRGSDGYDEYFVEAGNFVIEKGKASTSMIQRVFKVGFNRAGRIVSQLEEAGVVGPEEGTKPRRILMSQEEFDQFVEESV